MDIIRRSVTCLTRNNIVRRSRYRNVCSYNEQSILLYFQTNTLVETSMFVPFRDQRAFIVASSPALGTVLIIKPMHAPSLVKDEKADKEIISREDGECWPRRVVTGFQPTGVLHVGNYFGAIRRCVQLQEEGEDLMIFVADLHSFTTHQNPSELQERSLELAACLLASGVDPSRSVVFAQSGVPRHAELCWLLACLATQARLAHLPQYRERAAAGRDVPLGLLLYPVLQAADVLLYRGTHVPVGRDQLQHLQLAAQLVRTFHHRFGRTFPTPRALLPEDGSERLLSLRDPSKKMSKSDVDPKSRILLTDSDDVIKLKIRKAVTDFTPQVTYEPEARPGVANLVRIHCLAAGKSAEEAVEEAATLTTAQYKRVVGEALCTALRPVRAEARRLAERPRLLRDVLRDGCARAAARADAVYGDVTRRVGLAYSR